MNAAVRLDVTDADLDREAVRRYGLAEFVRLAWHQVEPRPLVWSWHLDAMAEHLEAVTRREVRDLVINVPPGMSKSLTCSILWPAWVWTLAPTHKWICASYDGDLTLDLARKSRTLIASDWYRERWPSVRLPADASASKAVGLYYTSAGGMRASITPRGGATGKHADTFLIDDPIDPRGASASSGVEIDDVMRWYRETVTTRFGDHKSSARVLVMQRLHERDLAAEFVRSGATVLCLPMRYERTHPNRWARDPRTVDGELLCADRVPEDAVAHLEKTLGPTAAAAQLQQRPSPAGGNVFKREWLQHYWVTIPPKATWTLSVDCAFKGTDTSDFVAIQVWATVGPNFYLVDQQLERLDFVETCLAILAWTERYPMATKKLVEDKANGPAVLSVLRQRINGLQPVTPEGGKESRANSVQPLFASGNVLLPHPTRAEYPDGRRGAEWVRGHGVGLDAPEAAAGSYEHSMVTFPNAANDDDVDATTQFLNHAGPRYAARLEAAMAAVFGGST